MADALEQHDPRAFALAVLMRVEDGDFADAILGEGLTSSRMGPKDRALATRLVYGTLGWQGYLDHIIGAFSSRPVDRIDPQVRTLLRLALLQICRLDRVPGFAAVNTAVELCKRHDRRASGFVNALLRKASEHWEQVPMPDAQRDLAGHLAIAWSHPRWLVALWLRELGEEETRALLLANNADAPTAVRVNPLRTNRAALLERLHAAGVAAEATAYSPDGIRLEWGAASNTLAGFSDGEFSFQGEASQLVGRLVGTRPGERVLDLCAAPGGKSCHLAEQMENRGSVVAIDLSDDGIARLSAETKRLGLVGIEAIVGNALRWADPDGTGFDRVLVDAPCSGLGTLRQHPEIRWRRSPADLTRNAGLQAKLLRHAARMLRPGGILVYATCTIAAAENEDVVRDFCSDGGFRVTAAQEHLDPTCSELVDQEGFLRTFPHKHELDGFFAARLMRVGAASSVRP